MPLFRPFTRETARAAGRKSAAIRAARRLELERLRMALEAAGLAIPKTNDPSAPAKAGTVNNENERG